jgi:hypothetical protein
MIRLPKEIIIKILVKLPYDNVSFIRNNNFWKKKLIYDFNIIMSYGDCKREYLYAKGLYDKTHRLRYDSWGYLTHYTTRKMLLSYNSEYQLQVSGLVSGEIDHTIRIYIDHLIRSYPLLTPKKVEYKHPRRKFYKLIEIIIIDDHLNSPYPFDVRLIEDNLEYYLDKLIPLVIDYVNMIEKIRIQCSHIQICKEQFKLTTREIVNILDNTTVYIDFLNKYIRCNYIIYFKKILDKLFHYIVLNRTKGSIFRIVRTLPGEFLYEHHMILKRLPSELDLYEIKYIDVTIVRNEVIKLGFESVEDDIDALSAVLDLTFEFLIKNRNKKSIEEVIHSIDSFDHPIQDLLTFINRKDKDVYCY